MTANLFSPTLSERIAERTKELPEGVLLGTDETAQTNGLVCVRRAIFDADFLGATLFDIHFNGESAFVLVSWATGEMIAFYSKDSYRLPDVLVAAAQTFKVWLDSGMAVEDYEAAVTK